jgi:tRNA 2-thiocytidine biosynthesis protein TtcA
MKKKETPSFNRLCRLAGQAVGRYRMIHDGDRILVGLSGGKDSITLLHVLRFMQQRAPVRFELFPAVFDPGFPGFGLTALQKYAGEQHWDLHIIRTDVAAALDPAKENVPCVLCSRIRRGKLANLAAELRCNKLALGHHLDDLLISFLISAARGQGLTTMGPNIRSKSEPSLRIIRPLALAEESLIREAAAELGGYPESGKCMYHDLLEDGDRVYFREMLEKMSEKIPHIRSQMLRSLSKVETGYLLDSRFLDL